MLFSLNGTDYRIIAVSKEKSANAYAIFKCESQTKINPPIAIALGDIDLQRVLKNLFLKEVFNKSFIKR